MENDIRRRLYSCINSYSIPMMEFLKLTDIEFSELTNTACVTVEKKPKLLLNKDFIDKYCKTDEHLFMLIMHEMYHIILGHTKLFKRVNTIDNIVFDAIINSILVRTFKKREYISFFININNSSEFPSCILRPKDIETPSKYNKLLDSLYKSNKCTYREVYEQLIKDLNLDPRCSFILLGNHDNNQEYGDEFNNLFERIVETWPTDKENGFNEDEIIGKFNKNKQDKRRIKELIKFFDGCGLNGKLNNTSGKSYSKSEIMSFIPSIKDRTYFTKKIFYNALYFKNEAYKINDEYNTKTIVYVDVSGSVEEYIGEILNMLEIPVRNNLCELYCFSDIVDSLTISNFINKSYKTTYGTNINCCFEHFFSEKRNANRIIIITDGYTGKTDSKYLDRLKRIDIKCLLFGSRTYKNDLNNIVNKFKEIK